MVAHKHDDLIRASVFSDVRRRIRRGVYAEGGFSGMTPLKIYIGFDQKEAVTWHVLAHSIMARSSKPVQICPISLSTLNGIFNRERDAKQSTDFTYARFLTPYLAGPGISIFMDSDMLCLCDIWELEALARANPYSDVLVVKHVYSPREGKKFLGNEQTIYPCKNWSSLMVFNGHRQALRNLTPDYVNTAEPMDLHRFRWALDVGALPGEYNHLVGEYLPNPHAKIVHYTLGAPCFREYQTCEYAYEWFKELGRMTYCADPHEGTYNADLSRCPEPDFDGLVESGQPERSSQERDSGSDPALPADGLLV